RLESVRVVSLCCLQIPFVYFFFFSSRRRHTIWPRDWSSDVCSSDLSRSGKKASPCDVHGRPPNAPPRLPLDDLRPAVCRHHDQRSEERRVGKECKSRR